MLLESLVSVVLLLIGLLAIVGVATQALNQVSQSKARNDASYLAGELIGELWVAPTANWGATITAWQARVAANLPGGVGTVPAPAIAAAPAATEVDVTITWTDNKNQGVTHSYSTSASIGK